MALWPLNWMVGFQSVTTKIFLEKIFNTLDSMHDPLPLKEKTNFRGKSYMENCPPKNTPCTKVPRRRGDTQGGVEEGVHREGCF